MRQAEHHIRLPGWAWSLILAAGALARAVLYPDWANPLILGAALIAIGIATWILTGSRWSPWPAFLGHVVLLAIDITGLATIMTTTSPHIEWLVFWLLVNSAILNVERILCIGTNIGRR